VRRMGGAGCKTRPVDLARLDSRAEALFWGE